MITSKTSLTIVAIFFYDAFFTFWKMTLRHEKGTSLQVIITYISSYHVVVRWFCMDLHNLKALCLCPWHVFWFFFCTPSHSNNRSQTPFFKPLPKVGDGNAQGQTQGSSPTGGELWRGQQCSLSRRHPSMEPIKTPEDQTLQVSLGGGPGPSRASRDSHCR